MTIKIAYRGSYKRLLRARLGVSITYKREARLTPVKIQDISVSDYTDTSAAFRSPSRDRGRGEYYLQTLAFNVVCNIK